MDAALLVSAATAALGTVLALIFMPGGAAVETQTESSAGQEVA